MTGARRAALALACATALASSWNGAAAQGVLAKNMTYVAGAPNAGGNALDFFERLQPDNSVRRYAAAAAHGNGLDIVDVTDPTAPVTVSRYATPGFNYHPWIQVNPTRHIAALSIEDPGLSPAHGISNGIEFVDISDVTAPTYLGVASGLGGPHTIRMIGDRHVYTTLPTVIVDYTDPANPVNLGQSQICGHEFFEDPNVPGRTYAGICGNFKWAILDTSDAAHPQIVSEVRDLDVQFAHEVFPSPDGSYVGVADFRDGIANARCPGGGIHFYDVSGRYVAGASASSPKKMGMWFAPFGGVPANPSGTTPNWGSCTTHSWHQQTERPLVAAGVYTAGTWVMDPTAATLPAGAGEYAEWSQSPGRGMGPTTWGNTRGNLLAAGDFVNAAQWLPFDLAPAHERLVVTNGLVRGLDVLRYDGPMPRKVSRLTAAVAPGGIAGSLRRNAVLTHSGWAQKPLAGGTITATWTGGSATATVSDAGSWAIAVPSGAGTVTVAYAGDATFAPATVTVTI